jgi:hypothetical protein
MVVDLQGMHAVTLPSIEEAPTPQENDRSALTLKHQTPKINKSKQKSKW